MRALSILLLAATLSSPNAVAGNVSDLDAKISELIASRFELTAKSVKVVDPHKGQDYTAYIVNGVTECAVVEYEDGDKEVECDDRVIINTKELKQALGDDYKKL